MSGHANRTAIYTHACLFGSNPQALSLPTTLQRNCGHYLHQKADITGFTAFEIDFYFKTQLQISISPGHLISVFILKGCHYSGSRELMDKHRIRSAVHSLPHSQLKCTEPAQINSPHEHTTTRSTLDVL